MNTFTTEELLAWAGIAAAIAGVGCLYLGHRVGWRNGYDSGILEGWKRAREQERRDFTTKQIRPAGK